MWGYTWGDLRVGIYPDMPTNKEFPQGEGTKSSHGKATQRAVIPDEEILKDMVKETRRINAIKMLKQMMRYIESMLEDYRVEISYDFRANPLWVIVKVHLEE